MVVYISGIKKNLFNSKEIQHMIDVKNLILNIKLFNYLLWVAALILLLIKISLSKEKILISLLSITRSYFIYSVAILISTLILIALSFRWIFYFFHIISFDNNLWILDPRTDYLIKIFEEVFFMDAAIFIGILTLFSSIIIFLSVNTISKFTKN